MPVLAPTDLPALRCELTQRVSGSLVSISGRVFSANPGAGTYQLRIEKSGPSGTSVLNQGGAFTAQPPDASVVGSLTFSVEAGAHYKARLRVRSGDATAECQDGQDRL
jgi:hypothetical protein